MNRCVRNRPLVFAFVSALACVAGLFGASTAYAELDLSPLPDEQWSRNHAAHLASRAGFGATPAELDGLARLSPRQSVMRFLRGLESPGQAPFEHSGVFDEGLDPFPPSRPAATRLAREQGHAMGVRVKPGGQRPLQPVVDTFFYWLRASRLETDRVAYWWANRMLQTGHPLQEKMALFWHGHFATNEDKVRDYRKMLGQLELFQDLGLGGFRELLIAVAQDPAMLVFLDAGVNTKDSPNENFAREIMELFTMGVGHYGESDVQEAARAFTGWNVRGLEFYVDEATHDSGNKIFLGNEGAFDGVQIIDLILQQPQTARFIAGKLYEYFVNDELGEADRAQLGQALFDLDYQIGDFLELLFRSNEFYAPANTATRIKGPVEMMVSTYRLLELQRVPGVPDFNQTSGALGQRLMHPPTVAGWARGRSWITPSLLFERANFVLDVMFPDIGFIPPDRYPTYTPEIVNVQNRLRQGMNVSAATRPTGVQGDEQDMAASNQLADADEDFNTRLGSMRGWQMALERVQPVSRHTAHVDLAGMVRAGNCATVSEAVALLADRFLLVMPQPEVMLELQQFLRARLGTDDLSVADSYLEAPLRELVHAMLSLPEYQLG